MMPETRLTKRQLEVLELIARGRTDGEIAQELLISENTVDAHIRNIFLALGAKSRANAVYLALKSRLMKI